MTEENKKTIIAFIGGLLVGGLLLYMFIEPAAVDTDRPDSVPEAMIETEDTSEPAEVSATDTLIVDDRPSAIVRGGSVTVQDQRAGQNVFITDLELPSDTGWIGVRDYVDDRTTGLLGVVRWSKSEGLFPEQVNLMRSTEAGRTYAVVFYADNGDRVFSLATDAQIDGVMEIFKAE